MKGSVTLPRLGYIMLLGASVTGVQAQSMYPEFDAGSTAPAEVTLAVENLVGDFAARWSSRDWPTMLELWDPGEEAPYYLLSHQADWLIGWDQLKGYFSKKPVAPVKDLPEQAPPGIRQIELNHYEYRTEKDLIAMQYTATDIRVRQIAPDLALAAWYVQFDYKPMFMPAKGESFKANAVFRNTDDGWKFIHYAEAPMSAIMYFERMYRQQASPEFQQRFNKSKSPAGE